MDFRLATVKDCASLLRIYAQYIDTPITFEYQLPTESDFAQRIDDITKTYPFVVCMEHEQMIGYAYAHRQMERTAYQWNAELSVYLDASYTARGIGKKLYQILIEILKLQGIKTVYGGVTLPNIKSERLHRSLGFACLGIYHNTGFKCDAWHDVAWFERPIAAYDTHPIPIKPIHQLDEKTLLEIMQSFS